MIHEDASESAQKASEDGRKRNEEAKEEIPPATRPELRPNPAYFNTHAGGRVLPEPKAQFFTPVDPPHSHKEIMEQIFGEGQVPSFPCPEQPQPSMSGFLSWYARRCGEWGYPHTLDADEHHKVMHAYMPQDLPVLSTLAREYAFSDAWFCSMPGPTAPNRQFLHSATSAGHVANSGRPQHQPTLFDMLDAAGKAWKVYYHDISTVLTFSRTLAAHDFADRFVSGFERFEEDLRGDDFPAYSFIEPRVFDDPINGLYSNDQHPPHDVRRGEALLARVYEAMRGSRYWESSLLIVLYDEHGGYYDHVPPPYVRPAPAKMPASAPSGGGFDFSVLGPRVPAVFVSPLIERRRPPVRPRSSAQYFSHESFILTLAKMWDLDAAMLDWQHDPAQIATFEWLWQDTNAADSHKEEIRLPGWRELEASAVAFPHEGMDPYEGNYEVKWIGWAVASALFLRDDVRVDDPKVRRWCDDIIRLRDTLSAGPFMDGFHKVVEQTRLRLAAVENESKSRELNAIQPSALLALLQYLDDSCA